MNKAHKHKDVIIAWANGEKIEYRDPDTSNEWSPIKVPSWLNGIEYRVKPEPKESVHTFRIGVAAYDDETIYTFTVDTKEEEQLLQADPDFIGWISDWEPFLLTKVEK